MSCSYLLCKCSDIVAVGLSLNAGCFITCWKIEISVNLKQNSTHMVNQLIFIIIGEITILTLCHVLEKASST